MKYPIYIALALTLSLSSCDEVLDYSSSTSVILTSVSTGDASVTAVSATLTGTAVGLSSFSSSSYEVGVYYGTTSDPTTSGTKKMGSLADDGTITASLSDLETGVTYYYAAYVTLQGVSTHYGDVKSFVTTNASVVTNDVQDVTPTKATFTATISGTDGLTIPSTGVKIALAEDEVVAGTICGLDVQTINLLPGTTYYYAAFVQLTESAYVYGATKSFTTEVQNMEYVDLGLSVLWASYNVGAEAETESGVYFGYGDQTGLMTYTSNAYYPSVDIAGEAEYDVVANIGIDGSSSVKSSMPTRAQMNELINGTTQEWTTVDGVQGVRFTASNGNSIFMPAVGYRDGEEIVADGLGHYWSGSISQTNSTYATTLLLSDGSVKSGNCERNLGLNVRTVRNFAVLSGDNDKLLVGDLEGKGNIRLEMYNEYGDGTSVADPYIDPSSIVFSKNMVVTFSISGIDGNLIDGASDTHVAGLKYAEPTWGSFYMSELVMTKYEAPVTGDGTYSVWCEVSSTANGAAVLCVDINNLANELVDASLISATVESIKLDANIEQPINTDIVSFQNNNGDGRIEIYNEYGVGSSIAPDYYADLAFNGMVYVEFTISGIDGNLVDGAAGSYNTEICYADASWTHSYCGGGDYGSATVTGDGTYGVYTYLAGDCEGAIVWTIEFKGLWQELVDADKVTVSVNKIQTPNKL